MAYYIVCLKEEAAQVGEILGARFPDSHWPYNPFTHVIFLPDNKATIELVEVAKLLNIGESGHEGFVIDLSSWYGWVDDDFDRWHRGNMTK